MILPPCESRINARKTKSLQELILSFSKNVWIFYWPFLCKMFKSSSQSDFNRKVWFDEYRSFLAGTVFTLVTVSLWLCSAPRDRTDSGSGPRSQVRASAVPEPEPGPRSEARNRNIELERDGRPEGGLYCLLFTLLPPVSQTMLVVSNFGKIQNLML